MMARTSYHRHQILASIALATAVIAFIFLVVDSITSDDSGLLLSLRGIENTIQYDSDGRQLQAASTVIDPKTIEVVNRSPDFIAQVQELATTVPEQYLVQNQQQPQQKQYDPKYIYSIKCTIVDNLPTGWCMDEATQTPRYLGSSHQNNHSPATTAAAAIGTTYEILHYTHAGYDKCLSNKNIVFIGESRTRYQYMSLVHYLKSEKFLKCNDRTTNPDEDCFVIKKPEGISTKQSMMLGTGGFTAVLCAFAVKAREEGFKGIILPKENAREAAIVSDLEVLGVNNIKQLIDKK